MIEAINEILKDHNLGEVTRVQLENIPKAINEQATLQNEISDFIDGSDDYQGWLCLTDEVIILNKGYDLSSLHKRIILYGELASGEKSLHIRQTDKGWLAVKLTRKQSDDDSFIMYEESYISTDTFSENRFWLNYEIYWKETKDPSGQIVLAPFASRFAGFSKEDKAYEK